MKNLLQEGLNLFNARRWFEAHEAWESLWQHTQGETRSFYQGLIQIAVGLHHISHGNLQGGRRVLARGVKRLEAYPTHYMGIDNGRLLLDLANPLLEARVERICIHAAADQHPGPSPR